MKLALTLLVGFCSLTLSLPGAAIDSRGARPCSDWQQHRLDATQGYYEINAEINQTWLVGYLSGLVAGSGMDFLAGTNNAILFRMADDYCMSHPQADLAFVGNLIARALMQEKSITNVPTLP